jgi:hypothetical protein
MSVVGWLNGRQRHRRPDGEGGVTLKASAMKTGVLAKFNLVCHSGFNKAKNFKEAMMKLETADDYQTFLETHYIADLDTLREQGMDLAS